MSFYFEKYLSQSQLLAEYERASHDWPFITTDEQRYGLPRMLLYATGSRETNLRNVVGDGGHGHGVFQLDNRSHAIPNGFDQDVVAQAAKAAGMLKALLDQFNGNAQRALAAYNAGAGTVEYNVSHGLNVDTGTANGDYSRDVLSRMVFLANTVKDDDMTPQQAQQLADLHSELFTPIKMPNGYEINLATMIVNIYKGLYFGGNDAGGQFRAIADNVEHIATHLGV